MTDPNQTILWRWDSDPFGTTAANEDPDGDGRALTLNVRFAGQYFDSETGLHYNYFRYYDPATGRYISSDPIGLAGGLNTYGYVNANPILYFDRFGRESPIDWELPGGSGVVNFNLGFGGNINYLAAGGFAESGVAFDTTGTVCLYTRTCGHSLPTSVAGGGNLGVSAGVGPGKLCSRTFNTVGVFAMEGFILEGTESMEVEIGGDGLAMGKALLGVGGGFGGGGLMCHYEFSCVFEAEQCDCNN